MESLRKKARTAGSAVAKLLFFCVLLVAVALVLIDRGILPGKEKLPFLEPRTALEPLPSSPPAESTPAPAPREAPSTAQTPVEPVEPEAPPSEADAPSSTTAAKESEAAPAPEEPALTVELLAANPAWWPAQVVLSKATPFPIIFNGKVAGQAQVPAGAVLRLRRVIPGAPGQAGQVEVEYQANRQVVAADATDLLQRADAVRKTAVQTASPQPAVPERGAANRTIQASVPSSAPVFGRGGAPSAPSAPGSKDTKVKFTDRVVIEVARNKKTRIEGGDWDDQKDRIVLKVKLSNSDTMRSFDDLKGEVYILVQSILDPKVSKLLGKESFDFSLPPRGQHEFLTREVVSAFDTTGARFGYQYRGWIVRIRDKSGDLLAEKATNPTIAKNADTIVKLNIDEEFSR